MNPLWNELYSRASLTLSPEQDACCSKYLDLLLAANERMNLTAVTERAAAETLHVGEALTLLPHLPEKRCRLADVGSGGGVPGIPLAIARPDVQVFLIEATQKKAAYLAEAVSQLGLRNVRVLGRRVEEVGLDRSLRESFDVATARAVTSLNWLAEWCLPLLKVGGKMLAMKGPKVAEEAPLAKHAIRFMGGGPAQFHVADSPGDGRVIVESVKLIPSPRTHPRHPTVAKRKPL